MMANWTPEQQKEHRRLWVEALRSGKYQQAQGALHDAGGFCCLGVACDISRLGSWERSGADEDRFYLVDDDLEDSVLPIAVQRWLGLRAPGGEAQAYMLWHLNDNGETFAAIADIIEAEPAGLVIPNEAA